MTEQMPAGTGTTPSPAGGDMGTSPSSGTGGAGGSSGGGAAPSGGNRNIGIIAVIVAAVAIVALLILRPGASAPGATASPAPSSAASPSEAASAAPSASTAPSGATIASTFYLGGPPECPERPFCAVGLKDVYGIEFKQFLPLDAGGPLTVSALDTGLVDVGLLFTSDPSIVVKGYVLLDDDKHLQKADNLVPVIRKDALASSPGIADLLNPWMAKLTQDQLTALNKSVAVDGSAAKDVVGTWLQQNGLTTGTGGSGVTVKVGSTNFYEQEILGEIFAQVLEANGYTVERKFQLGNREIVFPALEKGDIDVLAEYAATALEFVNKGAGEATGDAAETVAKLQARIDPLGLTTLDFAPATDQNGFVVTKATADKYGLKTISDLAKPAP